MEKQSAKKEENTIGSTKHTVIENQIFEGLEFVNVRAKDGIVQIVVINNIKVKYEGSKFSMRIMDKMEMQLQNLSMK